MRLHIQNGHGNFKRKFLQAQNGRGNFQRQFLQAQNGHEISNVNFFKHKMHQDVNSSYL